MIKTLLIVALLPINLYAATSGSLLLTGIIPKKVEITVTPNASASTLDLETTQTNLSVATLSGKSNVNAGYKISVISTNNGKLVHSITPTQFVNYTLKIDSSSVALTGGGFLNYTGKVPFSKDVNISYVGVDGFDMDDGNYSDSLTFIISAN